MNMPAWVSTFLEFLGGHALLSRLFFASVEFGALALVVGVLIGVLRIHQPRLRALLWLVVLAKPLVGLAVGTPLPLLALRLTAPQPSVMRVMDFDVVQGAGPLAQARGVPDISVPVMSDPGWEIDWAVVIPRAMLGVWGVGVLAFALRLLISERRIGRIIRQAAAPSPWLAGRLAEVARGMGVAGVPPCRVTPALESPALVGFWRPVILLPEWISAEADPLRVEWSLRHELMHWRLRDPLAALVCELARMLFFFHPAVWWAGRRWQEATEMACDRALIHSLEDAALYAEELYRMLMKIRVQRRIPVAGGLFAGRTQIRKRIESLVKNPLRSPAHLSAASLCAVIFFSCASMMFGIGSESRAAGREASLTTLTVPQAGLILDAKAIKKDPAKRVQVSAKSIKKDNDNTLYLEGDVRYGIDFGPFAAVVADSAVTASSEEHFVQLTLVKTPLDLRERHLVELGRAAHSNPLEKVWAAADKVEIALGAKEVRLEGNAIVVQRKKPDELWVYRSSKIFLFSDASGQPDVGITKAIRGYNGPALTVIKADEIIGKPAAIDLGKGNDLPFDKMRADSVQIDPDGSKSVLAGKVRIESKEMDLAADAITIDNKAKRIEAKGKPVKLTLKAGGNGAPVQGECGLLTVDLRTSSILMQDNPAIIRERKNGEKTRSTAETIRIDRDGAGRYTCSLIGSQISTSKLANEDKLAAEDLMATGWAQHNQGKLAEAEATFKKALEKDPSNADLWNGLGWAQHHQGKLTEAEATFKKALEKNPSNADLWNGLGWTQHNQGKLAEAEATFKKAVEKDPSNANLWNGLGCAQFNQGKPLNAKKSFGECLKRDPKQATALNGLGWIAKGEGKTDEAIGYWKRAVEALPEATAALSGLARTSMEQKNYKEAEQYFEQWLKVEPNSAEAKDGLEKARAAPPASRPASARRT